MKNAQAQVREFMKRAGQECPEKPTLRNVIVRGLRIELIAEELGELRDAYADQDAVAVADAIGDLLYVVLGAAVAHGIEIEPIFNEIHRSNLSKFVDGHRRADGKWEKGLAYSPANLKPLIEAQSHAGEH